MTLHLQWQARGGDGGGPVGNGPRATAAAAAGGRAVPPKLPDVFHSFSLGLHVLPLGCPSITPAADTQPPCIAETLWPPRACNHGSQPALVPWPHPHHRPPPAAPPQLQIAFAITIIALVADQLWPGSGYYSGCFWWVVGGLAERLPPRIKSPRRRILALVRLLPARCPDLH